MNMYGGAAMNVSSQAEFRDCAFEQNQASYAGGAVASWMRGERPLAPVFRENVFAANTAIIGDLGNDEGSSAVTLR